MDYELIEASVDYGSPVFLYEFIYGERDSDAYRYASTLGEEGVVSARGTHWTATQVKSGDITNSGSLDKAELEIRINANEAIGDLFQVAPPSRPIQANIWRGHIDSDDYKLIWSGRLVRASWEDIDLVLTGEPLTTSLRRLGLRRFYQYGCSHVLYGTACGVPKSANTLSAKIIDVASAGEFTIRVVKSSFAVVTDEFLGGSFDLTLGNGVSAKRSIKSFEAGDGGYVIQPMGLIADLKAGLSLTVSKGCLHTYESCKERFGNVMNYGGCPNIPTKNPFTASQF